jgi:hypothetical protein
MIFTCVAPRIKSKGLPIGGPLLSKKFMLFTHIAPRTKSKGLPIGSPLLSKKLVLFTRVASRTKSKEAPDQRPTHLLLLSARALSHIKSKGLHRYVL